MSKKITPESSRFRKSQIRTFKYLEQLRREKQKRIDRRNKS